MTSCGRCGDKGAVTIRYGSGERSDVAVCWCPAGRRLRAQEAANPGVLATVAFPSADRVLWLEDAADLEDFTRWGCERPGTAPAVSHDVVRQAGRVNRAGLGGQKVRP